MMVKTHPLFNGEHGRYKGIPDEEVKTMSHLADLILTEAFVFVVSKTVFDALNNGELNDLER